MSEKNGHLQKNSLPRSFRVTCGPERVQEAEELLRAEGFDFEPEPFSAFCRRLAAEPMPLGSSLAAFFGLIYIQDRSSMLPPLALNPPVGASVLDMCASPGSKSGFLAQLAGQGGFVLANEPNRQRLDTLRVNLRRCNFLHVGTCLYSGEEIPLAPETWHYILLDPPCSGWGTAIKNPKAPRLWQGKKIDRLTALQRSLLRKAASLLAPGGRLLYSTCTTNEDENEAQASYACHELGLEVEELAPFAGFQFESPLRGSLLVDGEASEAQGFFLCLLRKPHGDSVNHAALDAAARLKSGWAENLQLIEPGALAGPVFDPAALPDGHIAIFGETARFLPLASLKLLPKNFVWQAQPLGTFKKSCGKSQFSPSPGLARLLKGKAQEHDRAIVLEETAAIRSLLSGSALRCGLPDGYASLWWRNLPLCICQVRNGRVIAPK